MALVGATRSSFFRAIVKVNGRDMSNVASVWPMVSRLRSNDVNRVFLIEVDRVLGFSSRARISLIL